MLREMGGREGGVWGGRATHTLPADGSGGKAWALPRPAPAAARDLLPRRPAQRGVGVAGRPASRERGPGNGRKRAVLPRLASQSRRVLSERRCPPPSRRRPVGRPSHPLPARAQPTPVATCNLHASHIQTPPLFPPLFSQSANGLPPPPPGGPAARPVINHKFGPTDGFALSADEYRRKHDLTVVSRGGPPPPDPLQTFESAGFSDDIMREVSVW